jgi:hypothetical protein
VRVGGGGGAGPLYAGLRSEGEPEAVGDGEGDVSTGRRLKLGIGQGVTGRDGGRCDFTGIGCGRSRRCSLQERILFA